MQQPKIPTATITIVVALSENGETDCHIADHTRVQKKKQFEDWMASKRNDTKLWHLKTIQAAVPMPVSFEDMTKEDSVAIPFPPTRLLNP